MLFVDNGAHVLIDATSCGEADPESGVPDEGDPLDDPEPDSDAVDSESLVDVCATTSTPDVWNCDMFSAQPCSPDEADATCISVDERLVYPRDEGWIVDSTCEEAHPDLGCGVLVDRADLDIDYGPDHFAAHRDAVKACAVDPSACEPKVVEIFVSCDLAREICELQIDVEVIGPAPPASDDRWCGADCAGILMDRLDQSYAYCEATYGRASCEDPGSAECHDYTWCMGVMGANAFTVYDVALNRLRDVEDDRVSTFVRDIDVIEGVVVAVSNGLIAMTDSVTGDHHDMVSVPVSIEDVQFVGYPDSGTFEVMVRGLDDDLPTRDQVYAVAVEP